MTAPNAPGGLKLTEKQVDAFWQKTVDAPMWGMRPLDEQRALITDWRTLRADRDAKDAEIARLKEVIIEHERRYGLSRKDQGL